MAQPRRGSGRPGTSKKPAAKPAKAKAPAPKKTVKALAKPAKAAAKAKPPARPAAKHAAKPTARPPATRPVARAGASRPATPTKAVAAKGAPAKAVAARKGAVKVPPPPPTRSRYAEAVGTYERAMQALQGKRYRDAAALLKKVITEYPDEKELLERAQLYMRFCERQLAPLDATPKTSEERIYAATLSLNAGDPERAVQQLTAALAQDPANDHAEYMLGVALAVRGNTDAAIPHLERAVALNHENRDLIAKEPDLEALRQTEVIAALLAAPPPPPPTAQAKDKRAAGKTKAGR
jgi:tetratricopeptide (TPR) repeat protein